MEGLPGGKHLYFEVLVRPRERGGVVCVAGCVFSQFVLLFCFVFLRRDGGAVVISLCT